MAALVISSIQRGSTVIGSADTTVNQSITAVTLANAIVRVNGARRTGGTNVAEARYFTFDAQLTSTTNIQFTRALSGSAMVVEWEVINYSSGISVQRGAVAWGGGGTNNITVTAVTLSQTFPIVNSSGDPGGEIFPIAQTYLTSTTNLRYIIPDPVFGGNFAWQLVSIDDASVQAAQGALGTGTTSDITITSVTMNKTFLECNWGANASSSAYDGEDNVIWSLTSATNIRFQRQGASAPASNYATHAVSIGGSSNFNVQRGVAAFASSTTATASLTSVDTSKTQLHLLHTDCIILSSNQAGNCEQNDCTTGVITSSTVVTFQKNTTTDRNQTFSWETMEEKAAGGFLQKQYWYQSGGINLGQG